MKKIDVKSMLKKLKHILIGWLKAYGFLPSSAAEKKLSQLRLKQCSGCIYADESKVLKLLNGNATYEKSLYCTKCVCPADQKSLVVDENCPIGKW